MKTHRKLMREIQEFKLWEAWFRVSPAGKSALEKLHRLKNGGNELNPANLASTALATCYIAANYDAENDRVDDQGHLAGLKYQRKLIAARKKRKPASAAEDSLVAHLTMLFRYFTSNESTFGWGGERLPDFGEPCYAVTAGFVNAVFPHLKRSPGEIAKIAARLKKEGVRLVRWPLA
jgi:hypothetical protein